MQNDLKWNGFVCPVTIDDGRVCGPSRSTRNRKGKVAKLVSRLNGALKHKLGVDRIAAASSANELDDEIPF
jgi:hypothetical protein